MRIFTTLHTLEAQGLWAGYGSGMADVINASLAQCLLLILRSDDFKHCCLSYTADSGRLTLASI